MTVIRSSTPVACRPTVLSITGVSFNIMEEESTIDKRQSTTGGKLHGDDYFAYTKEDIKQITDIKFLRRLMWNIHPSAQPTTRWEQEELEELISVITNRKRELRE